MDDGMISGGTAPPSAAAPETPTVSGAGRKLPLLSVIVSAGRDGLMLQRCLDALLDQAFDGSQYEIVVVEARNLKPVARVGKLDAGVSPRVGKFGADRVPGAQSIRSVVIETARRGAGSPAVQYLPADRPARVDDGRSKAGLVDVGSAAARNRGWHFARGSMIAFLDASLVPGAGWIQHGLDAMSMDVAAVIGRVRVPLSTPPSEEDCRAWALAARGQYGSNCFVRRAALAAVGGYDERLPADWRTDADLQFSLLDHYRGQLGIRQAPGVEVTRQTPAPAWGSSLGIQRNLQFDALLARKHPSLYSPGLGSPVSGPAHGLHLVIVVSLGLFAAAVLASQFLFIALTASLWWLLTATICVQRLRGTSHAIARVLEIVLTSIAMPPLAVFWRCVGMLRFRHIPY